MKKQFTIRNEGMRIAGKTVFSENEIRVLYPFTEEIVGSVPAATVENVQKAFSIAANYKSKLSRYERQQILFKIAEIIKKRKDELAPIITSELGISINDSLYEIGRAYDVYTLAGQLCIQDDGEIFSCDLTPHGKARKIFTIREPLRSISAITPFNHPLNMISHKIAPAIATNNCIVAKPTELTPLTAIYLADIIYEAGLPPEMLSVVTGLPEEIGNEIITNPNIELITFTGGIPVGKIIANKAGYKRQVLELGGNDPYVILDNADINVAVKSCVEGRLLNAGQSCISAKRLIVTEKNVEVFTKKLLKILETKVIGDPHDDVDLGPLVSEDARNGVHNLVEESINSGANLILGGKIPKIEGAYYPITVLVNVNPGMTVFDEEVFGPVFSITTAKSDNDAIKLANKSNFGLGAAVFTSDIKTGEKIANERIQSGLCFVNDYVKSDPRLPFGGIKSSGYGRELSSYGLMEFVNIKTVVIQKS